MNINEISQKQSKLMAQAYEYIRKNPETAYEEYKTDAYMKEEFKKLGYIVEPFDKITGFTATFDTGREGKTLGLFAELEILSIPCQLIADVHGLEQQAVVPVPHEGGKLFVIEKPVGSHKVLGQIIDRA